MGLFERSYVLLGMESALVAYLEQPEAMAALLQTLTDNKIELIERYHNAARLCKECEFLIYGMCSMCGCYVEVRAWKKRMHCANSEALW